MVLCGGYNCIDREVQQTYVTLEFEGHMRMSQAGPKPVFLWGLHSCTLVNLVFFGGVDWTLVNCLVSNVQKWFILWQPINFIDWNELNWGMNCQYLYGLVTTVEGLFSFVAILEAETCIFSHKELHKMCYN